MADYGIQIGRVVFVGLLSVITTINIVVGLEALYYWQLGRVEVAEESYQPPAKLKSLAAAQQTRLTDYRVVDAKTDIVAIPIGRAMDLVVADLSRHGATTVPKGEKP